MYDFGATDRVVNRPTSRAVALVTPTRNARFGSSGASSGQAGREGVTARPLAAAQRAVSELIAQLVAGRIGMPQTRTRRRAEPQEAVAAYAEASTNRGRPRAFGRRVSIIT